MPPEPESGSELRRGTTVASDSRNDISLYEYFESRLKSQRDLLQARFEASQEAIRKAEKGYEDRFASVNEFRGQLNDQARTFVTRETMDSNLRELRAVINQNSDSVSEINRRLANIEGRFVAYGGAITVFFAAVEIALHFLH